MKVRRLLVLAVTAATAAMVASAASAAWDVTGGGNATSSATSLGSAGLTATTTFSSVNLTPVAPTTGPAVGSYTIMRGATVVCSTTGSACPDPSLSPSATYTYTVTPALQNWNGPTTTATFTTPPSPTPAAALAISSVVRDGGNKKVHFTGTGAVATTSIVVTICTVNSFPCATGNVAATSTASTPAAGNWISSQSTGNNLNTSQNYYAQAVQGSAASAAFPFSTTNL